MEFPFKADNLTEKQVKIAEKMAEYANLLMDNANNQYSTMSGKSAPAPEQMLYAMNKFDSRVTKQLMKMGIDAKMDTSAWDSTRGEAFLAGELVDQFCEKVLKNVSDDKLGKIEKILDNSIEAFSCRKDIENNFKQIEEKINDKKLSDAQLLYYMRGYEETLNTYPGLHEVFPPIANYLDSREKANEWLNKVKQNVQKVNKLESLRTLTNVTTSMIESSELMNSRGKQVQAIGTLYKLTKGERNRNLDKIFMNGRRNLAELKGKRLIPLKTVLDKRNAEIRDAAFNYIAALESNNLDHKWDAKTARKIGAAIDVICSVDPDPKKKKEGLLYQYDVRIAGKDYVPLGPEGMYNRSDEFAEKMLETIRKSDSNFIKSSREFKDFRKAAELLVEKTSKFNKDGSKKDRATVMNDKHEILKLVDSLLDSSQRYINYKISSLKGAKPNPTEQKRLKAANSSGFTAENIRAAVRDETINSAKNQGPQGMINAVQEELYYSKDSNDRYMAELLYLETVSRSFNGTGPVKNVEEALQRGVMDREVDKMMDSPIFKMTIKDMPKYVDATTQRDKLYNQFIMNKSKYEAKSNLNEPKEPKKQAEVKEHQKPVNNSILSM